MNNKLICVIPASGLLDDIHMKFLLYGEDSPVGTALSVTEPNPGQYTATIPDTIPVGSYFAIAVTEPGTSEEQIVGISDQFGWDGEEFVDLWNLAKVTQRGTVAIKNLVSSIV